MTTEWRPLRLSDLPAASGLNRIVGWNQTEADWRDYLAFEPDGCLAVELDGELAGTATCIRYGERLGWIGMVLVHPSRRRLGLGRELLGRTIRYLTGRGTRSIRLDATAMGRTVYLPLGFRDEFEVTRFEGVGAGLSTEGQTGLLQAGVEQLDRACLSSITDLDEEAFGVRRAEVLAALSRRNPDLCFVARAGGGISGYLIAREGREAIQLGPSAARDPAVAERLYRAVFHAVRGRRVFLDLPAPNRAGGEILARHGFKTQRSFMRMILGEAGPPGRNDFIYGTSGAEKG
jgi:ribosomal protein S18 acetylase RimI-like enzyme